MTIISSWIVTPIIGFWIGGAIGRYVYPEINRRVKIEKSDGPLLALDRSGPIPTPAFGAHTTRSELASTTVVILTACYMAFSAEASNVPNAAAPMVGGAGGMDADSAMIVATLAIGLGGFTMARRTMASVGSELSDIPLLAAVFVMATAATITTALLYIGIPISLVMATVMTIVGIGWGRATRPITFREAVTRHVEEKQIAPSGITAEELEGEPISPIEEAEPEEALLR